METPQIRDFRRILRRFERVTGAQLKNNCAGVTLAQCLVLMEVDECGRLNVGQLATRLRLDNSTLSRTIEGLVRKGMFQRTRDEQDRRVTWIELTPAGKSVCTSIHEQNDSIYRTVFDKIPAAKRTVVVRHFAMLVQAFLDSEEQVEEEMACQTAPADATEPAS